MPDASPRSPGTEPEEGKAHRLSHPALLGLIVGLLCVLGVPLSYLASRASVHPDFTRPDESLDWRLGVILLYSTVAFTLLYAELVAMRVRLLRMEERFR